MASPRLAFAGTPAFAATVLQALQQGGLTPSLVITQPDKPAGRGLSAEPSAVAALASQLGIEVRRPARIAELAAALTDYDVLVVAAYGQILPKAVLDAPHHGCLNVHASLLPAYRGASPVSQAILDGCAETGVTIMQIDEGLDTGPILSQRMVPIADDDTTGSLSAKLAEAGGALLTETLPKFLAGQLTPQPQDDAKASHTTLLKKADGRIDWQQPAAQIERHIRAMQPWPGATTLAGQTPLTILGSRVCETTPGQQPGDFDGPPLVVRAGEGGLQIEQLKPAGKSQLAAADWLRGYRGPRRFS